MSILSGAGKEAGVDAAKEFHGAADHVADKVGEVANELGLELADAVSILAGSFNRLTALLAIESKGWRSEVSGLTAQVSRFADFLDRVQIKAKS